MQILCTLFLETSSPPGTEEQVRAAGGRRQFSGERGCDGHSLQLWSDPIHERPFLTTTRLHLWDREVGATGSRTAGCAAPCGHRWFNAKRLELAHGPASRPVTTQEGHGGQEYRHSPAWREPQEAGLSP